MNIHPFVQLVIVIWFFAAVAAWVTKKAECIGVAGAITAVCGFGYLLVRLDH